MRNLNVLMVVVSMALLAGACHAEQNWLEPGAIPFVVDPNVDNYIVAARIEAAAAAELRIEQYIESHIWPVTVTYSNLPVWARAEGPAVFMLPTVSDVGLYYWTVTATDEPPFFIEPCSVTGIWAIEVLPKNLGPVLVPFVR